MEEKEVQRGCRGCVDHSDYSNCCGFLKNHGRVRPVPAGPEGCVLKSPSWAEQAVLEKQHAWSQTRVRRLLEKGVDIKDVAEKVGASRNAISAMLNGKVPPKTPEIPERKAQTLWGNEELPLRPTFQDAAKCKREQAVQPIQEVVKCKRKQKGRNSVEKGTWHWAREEEFLPLYNAKMTDAEIGEKMGLAAKTIGIYRQKMGYPYIAGKHIGKKMKGTRAEHAANQRPPVGEDACSEGDSKCAEQSRAEQSRAEQPPEEVVSVDVCEQGMPVAELAKVLSAAVNGFDCPRVLLGPDGELIQGCEVNIKYGVDGKPERVTVLLT